MVEFLAGLVVAAVAVILVLEPLVSRSSGSQPPDEPDFTPLEESGTPKAQALLALREIEFDRATGKLSDADYAALRAKYSRAAVDAMKDEEAAGARGERVAGEPDAWDAAEAVVERLRGRGNARCPQCGPRSEAGAVFCSTCGRRLTDPEARPRCTSCGASQADGAKFCAQCGGQIAA